MDNNLKILDWVHRLLLNSTGNTLNEYKFANQWCWHSALWRRL